MKSETWFQSCFVLHHGQTDLVMQCIANEFEEQIQQQQARADFDEQNMKKWLTTLTGAQVFFMQAGFAMLCAGCVRKKNIQNTMLKNLLDACGAAVAFYVCGYAFAFGGQNPSSGVTFAGTQNFFLKGNVDGAFWFLQYAMSANSTTIVAGTLAERCQMLAYLCYSLFLTGVVYPIVAHTIWSSNGFLSAFAEEPFRKAGVIDFAGSGVVHLTGGITAMIAACTIGPRKGRFYDSDGKLLAKPGEIRGHSIALQCLGTMMLWFGWYGFNAGSVLHLPVENTGEIAGFVAANTSISAAAGAISALFTKMLWQVYMKGEVTLDLVATMNGALSGLVAVTASCGMIDFFSACVIGLVAGWIYLVCSAMLVRLRIDDCVDGIPIHLFNGAWGLVAVGLFSTPSGMKNLLGHDEHVGWFYSLARFSVDATLLGNQLLGVLFISAWTAVCMAPFFWCLDWMTWLRTDPLEEVLGLDAIYYNNGESEGLPDGVTKEDVQLAVQEHERKIQDGHEAKPDGAKIQREGTQGV